MSIKISCDKCGVEDIILGISALPEGWRIVHPRHIQDLCLCPVHFEEYDKIESKAEDEYIKVITDWIKGE